MIQFKTRIKEISKTNGKIILANDYDDFNLKLYSKTINNIKKLSPFICAIKFNFHLLLPLSRQEISKLNKTAHENGIQTIADIKLNDIGNTNNVTTETLWKMGFDAVIVNPIMGLTSLENVIKSAHRKQKGIITLCHMSAPEAKLSYDMIVKSTTKTKKIFQLFLDWALLKNADGIIAGATFPEIIKYCKTKTAKKLQIYSPGIGTQGGNVKEVLEAGSDYLIVGRTILKSKNPVKTAKELHLQTIQ